MADVSIKLSGEDYRLLCLEMEHHELTLKQEFDNAKGSGQARVEARKREARFHDIMQKVKQ